MEAEALQIFKPAFLTIFVSSLQELSQCHQVSIASLVIVQIYHYSSIHLICPCRGIIMSVATSRFTELVTVMDKQSLLRIRLAPSILILCPYSCSPGVLNQGGQKCYMWQSRIEIEY